MQFLAVFSMRAFNVVMPAPALDYYPGFFERAKDFATVRFVAKTRVEALDEAIPRSRLASPWLTHGHESVRRMR